jgi:3-hydroxyacyl-CoA dehydrogenase
MAATRLSTIQRHLSSTSATSAHKVERMTVFGAGLMGAGIAQVGAQNGMKVCCMRTPRIGLPQAGAHRR